MSYCILPFVNLEARTDGTISPCCIMQDSAPQNLSEGDNLSEVWKGKWLRQYQQQFLAGVKPEACTNCWKEEDAGMQSKRLRELTYYKNELGITRLEKPTASPITLDLKLGNICNSKCRICTSFASSQWGKEEIAIDPLNKDRVMQFNHSGSWPKRNDNFWKEVDEWAPTLKKLEFFGGEPLLIDRHYDILEKCVELGVAKDISISYNTNGSIFPEDKVDLWKEFKSVLIFFSIDDVNDRFNYIRHPGKFDQVIENMHKFSNLEGNFEFGIFQTIGILNICTMNDLTTFCNEHLPMRMHYNMVFEPKHMSAKCLPPEVKQSITQMYSGEQPEFIKNTIQFMNGEQYDRQYFDQFIHTTKFGDTYRKESFADTFPQLYELIKHEW